MRFRNSILITIKEGRKIKPQSPGVHWLLKSELWISGEVGGRSVRDHSLAGSGAAPGCGASVWAETELL